MIFCSCKVILHYYLFLNKRPKTSKLNKICLMHSEFMFLFQESQLAVKLCSFLTYVLIIVSYIIVFSMLFIGMDLVPIIPLVVIAIFQTYFVWVIQDYRLFYLDLPKPLIFRRFDI